MTRSVPFLKPPPLHSGDRVAVVAPAGPFDRASFEEGLALLAQRYQPSYDDGLFTKEKYLAGSDARRGEELQSALDDPSTQAIFCARGGYGSMRILSRLRLP